MKPEEAISAIKNNMPTKGTYTILTEALEVAIQALEKQVPKKPKISDGIVYERYEYCPSCGISVTDNYCGNCGQAIDWRNEE